MPGSYRSQESIAGDVLFSALTGLPALPPWPPFCPERTPRSSQERDKPLQRWGSLQRPKCPTLSRFFSLRDSGLVLESRSRQRDNLALEGHKSPDSLGWQRDGEKDGPQRPRASQGERISSRFFAVRSSCLYLTQFVLCQSQGHAFWTGWREQGTRTSLSIPAGFG